MKHIFSSPIGAKSVAALALFGLTMFAGCSSKKEEAAPTLAGTPGNPRFNLQFTNAEDVDLDLYVKTPDGTLIYYGNKTGQSGTLDVDCRCGTCPNGPNENIYWVPGSAPVGTYQFYVKYYGSCGSGSPSSDFTLRVVNNSTIVETYTGTLSPSNKVSQTYTKTY